MIDLARRPASGEPSAVREIQRCRESAIVAACVERIGKRCAVRERASAQRAALAILVDALGAARAEELYQDFQWEVIAGLAGDEWVITRAEVLSWLAGHRARGDS